MLKPVFMPVGALLNWWVNPRALEVTGLALWCKAQVTGIAHAVTGYCDVNDFS